MEYRTLSQIFSRLYLHIFLFRVGLLMLISSFFMALAILWPSIPMILKLFTVVMWSAVF